MRKLEVLLWVGLFIFGWTSAVNGKSLQFHSEKDAVVETAKNVKDFLTNTVCSDPKYVCLGNGTCCKGRPPNKFACCPYPQAVCCPDGIHCCPKGSNCDMIHHRCYRQGGMEDDIFEAKTMKPLAIAMEKETPLESKDVVCPGGGSSCPDGSTCCKLPTGGYGCCPLPKAVCCSDERHCCPNGYTCDVSAGTCLRGDHVIPFFKKSPAVNVVSETVKDVVCPGGGSTCPDGSTCCKLPTGGYGCCPLPKAVCCSDERHCCPNGYTCDVSAGTCLRGDHVIPFFKKSPAVNVVSETVKDVVCPGGGSTCPDGSTCCKLPTGGYGCCPLPKAVCCSDERHCCPNGYTCDVSAGTCLRGDHVIPFFKKSPAVNVVSETVKDVVCPGGGSTCPDGNTCCKLASGGYGCCPLPKAVCCSDEQHCCPNGYTCDVSAGTCLKGDHVIPFFKKSPAVNVVSGTVKDVVCPGGGSTCPDGSTCCKLPTGGYGCCPLPKAVCCSDERHCCPNGYTCDVSAGTCLRGDHVIPFFKKSPAVNVVSETVKDVVCPGGGSTCPDGNTCCKLASGGYGCCPLPKAVCCSDEQHCCPNGYTCDVSAGTCLKGDHVIPFFKKSPAVNVVSGTVKDVVCPGGGSTCPDGSTCCKLPTGGYGCCPLPKAVCCSDERHCCPNGYTCDVSAGTCLRGDHVIPFFKKSPAVNVVSETVKDVVCPGGGSTCPDGNTCCKLASGGYGCCPLPKAVCCSDEQHCCPNGYTCDVSAGTCLKGDHVIPFFKKSPAVNVVSGTVKDVVCPGGGSTCPDGSTCCKLPTGGYGCCPLPKAVCCSDERHCCPNGYTCDVSAGTCLRGDHVIPFFKKSPAVNVVSETVKDVVCPGGGSTCPDGNTCCKLASGGYGCCPLPKAVCCSDEQHCCPNGYTCDVSAGTCLKGDHVIPFFKKSPAVNVVSRTVKDVVCPGGGSTCPDGSTCCKLPTGGYGCCPLPKAVCCSDGQHCCPNGYTCDVSAGTCLKGDHVIPFFKKSPVLKAVPKKVKSVVCPDGQSECPDGHTCCLDSSGAYGCCPLPKAICCSDKLHCCPSGHTCDLSGSSCVKGSDVLPLFVKHAARLVHIDSRVEKKSFDED